MTQTAKNYADALYDLAWDEGLTDELLPQLKGVRDLLRENPDYPRLLSAANLPLAERLGVLDQALRDRVHPYVLNFVKILVERGHLDQFRDCFVRFRARYAQDHGILEATAVTAAPLSLPLLDKLSKRLSELTGQRIELDNRVDPSVLGGVRLEYNGRQLDGTLRHRLSGIEKTLSETVL